MKHSMPFVSQSSERSQSVLQTASRNQFLVSSSVPCRREALSLWLQSSTVILYVNVVGGMFEFKKRYETKRKQRDGVVYLQSMTQTFNHLMR